MCEVLPVAEFSNVEARREFLRPLVDMFRVADVATGHNVRRFDLPVLGAEVMRLGLPLLPAVMVLDTIRLPVSKGMKKGQDNLAVLLKVKTRKMPLNFQEWAEAYGEPDLATVRARVTSDVQTHMEILVRMREEGWLSVPRKWRPK